MSLRPLQQTSVSLPRAQQVGTIPMQAATLPATTTTTAQLDINTLITPLISIMIVMMMMKMMTGAMGSIAG